MNEFTTVNGFQGKKVASHKFISISKIDSKGRLLIPKKVRKKFPSSVFFILLKDDRMEIKPVNKRGDKK